MNQLGNVAAIDTAIAVVSGEIMALIPEPPTPPRRSHRLAESHEIASPAGDSTESWQPQR